MRLLWPNSLCELLVVETNRYALQRRVLNWKTVTVSEMWTFLGIIVLIGFHVLPRLSMFWSRDHFVGIRSISECMSRARFRRIMRNLHLVDNTVPNVTGSRHVKVKPLVSCLQRQFLMHYYPSQEMSVDELMIKCKARTKAKVYMPKKPVKRGFKVWCCSCSCCGYLCSFNIYAGKCTAQKEVGLAANVVKKLVEPFHDNNHVLYCDNYFTSVGLVLDLAANGIYYVGTIKSNSIGLPAQLKGKLKQLARGNYICVSDEQRHINFYAYHDRKMVRFITNVFPPAMRSSVRLRQASSGLLVKKHVPPLLPAYNKYMGAVDRTGQQRQYYGIDRKCKRPWLRIFFHLFDLTVNNAHVLYKHNCRFYQVDKKKVKDLLGFRLELVHCLLDRVRITRKRRHPASHTVARPALVQLCRLQSVSGTALKRGRCFYCLKTQPKQEQHHTTFCCVACGVRLCKTPCYEDYHRHFVDQ